MNVNFNSVSSFLNSNKEAKSDYIDSSNQHLLNVASAFKSDTFVKKQNLNTTEPFKKNTNLNTAKNYKDYQDLSFIGTVGRLINQAKNDIVAFSDRIINTRFKDSNGNTVKVKEESAILLNTLHNVASQRGVKIQINSAYRSVEHQEKLWNQALKKYGSVSVARKWVAPPGHSQHNKGYALDVAMYRNGKRISQSEFDKIINMAGFYRPMSWEGWHIEPLSTKKVRHLA